MDINKSYKSEISDLYLIEKIKKQLKKDDYSGIILSSPLKRKNGEKLYNFLDSLSCDVLIRADKKDSKEIKLTYIKQPSYNIAIDGPSGSGKSTIAKALSQVLDIDYLDTGAMYRAMTFLCLRDGVDLKKEKEVCSKAQDYKLAIRNNRIYYENEDLDSFLRSQEVTKNVSIVSSYQCVRDQLVEMQRRIAKESSLILDGRDIGSVVLPDAKYKFYLDASAEVRAKRRHGEIKDERTYEEVLKDIIKRDEYDMNREISPLVKAEDAIEIDSSNLSIAEVVETMLMYMRKK